MLLRECDACGAVEERVFTDSWTGQSYCLMCLAPAAGRITMSPATSQEGDNINEVIPIDK